MRGMQISAAADRKQKVINFVVAQKKKTSSSKNYANNRKQKLNENCDKSGPKKKWKLWHVFVVVVVVDVVAAVWNFSYKAINTHISLILCVA